MKFNIAVELYMQSKYKEAFDMFFECDLTDMEVQYWIGYMYLEGLGVEQDRNKGETWLLKSAQQGDSSAQLMLGVIYREQEDYENAIKWFTISADQNNALAQRSLGCMYNLGEGVSINHEIAFRFFSLAANQGDTTAQINLGQMYYNGNGCIKDFDKARQWNIIAAESGDLDAQFLLGFSYQYDDVYPQDLEKAFYWYKKSAEQGCINSFTTLGYMYEMGYATELDYKIAFEWYKKAADMNDSAGQWAVGKMYENGYGVEQDYHKAMDFYRLAASQNNIEAITALGWLYEYGLGVEQDLKKAYEYYSIGSQQDDNCSLFLLARMYEEGKGVTQNYQKAFELHLRSAQLGHSGAQYCVGTMYECGLGVEKNIQKALEYWKMSDQNRVFACPEAAYQLGYAYYDGYGVERNLEKAKEYFEKAIEQGYHCSYALNMVKGELGELENRNKMREYADGLMQKHIPNTKLYQQISKDLQKDFGKTWAITCRETKKFLETGVFTYFSLYSLGPHIYGNMDFSASITPMFKALEKELGKYLYSGYIEFLKKKEVSPNTFPQKRSHIKRISSTELAYRDPSDLTEFTLGNLHLTVGLERKPQFAENDTFKYTIDQTMLDYLNSIFKEDAFGEAKREREITDYIISLTQEVTSIADSLRNPAAHSETMKCQKAEVCGNYIIKVQRILIDFLEKVEK